MARTEGFPLKGAGVPLDVRRALTTIRVIAAFAEDPKVQLSVDALAEATGLVPAAIREILLSEEYSLLIKDVCQQKALSVLHRAIDRIERAINSDKDAIAMDAVAKATTLYKVLAESGPKHRGSQAEQDAEILLKQLEATGQLRRVEATISPA